MPCTPSSRKRLPAGLLAAATLDSLDDVPLGAQVGTAFLDHLLQGTAPGMEVRLPAGEAIHVRRRRVATEML